MRHKPVIEIKKTVDALVKKVGSRDPFVIAKHLGILVIKQPLQDAHGMWLYEKRIKAILLNEALSEGRQRLVCAHELGHAILHPNRNVSSLRAYTSLITSHYEVEANYFAFELELKRLDEDATVDGLIMDYDMNTNEVRLLENYFAEIRQSTRDDDDYDW
ncbi:MAG: ImmA/IrrE family metallo-endopeptidase [Turicibacter sp.]|nr:ImmA/IrrE family metallo-endopeptidase [Turicibacter sp.]